MHRPARNPNFSKSTKIWISALALTLGGACAAENPAEAHEALTKVTKQLPNIPLEMIKGTKVATAVEEEDDGPHLGFDTFVYPGEEPLRTWKAAGKYEWVGYYLPAPCHKDQSWMGKRDTIEKMGWGVAVIYVGQQTWGKMPKATAKVAGAERCSATLVNGARGAVDGDDAVATAAAEGFPNGTVIFLDIERMDRVPKAMRDYYIAWTVRVLEDGRFRPGYYAHNDNAALIHGDIDSLHIARGITTAPPFWVAGGRDFSLEKAPVDVGHAFAVVWQGILDVVEEQSKVSLPIDVNVASVPSPSSHEYTRKTVTVD
jgi:hypothetical protein